MLKRLLKRKVPMGPLGEGTGFEEVPEDAPSKRLHDAAMAERESSGEGDDVAMSRRGEDARGDKQAVSRGSSSPENSEEHDGQVARDNDSVKVFKDESNEYRWHRVAANGKIISDSGEGYRKLPDAMRMAEELNPGIKPEYTFE